jgi:hypothetical protein
MSEPWTPNQIFVSGIREELDTIVSAALNANVSRNQHRWRESLRENLCGVLDDAAARLGWAWTADKRHPETYPLNTSYAFGEIKEWIREAQQGGLKRERKRVRFRRPPPPMRFSDLVDDQTVRAVYEEKNADSYFEALKRAASADKSAHFTFHKILNAVESAYLINYFGDELAPRPKVHFLHRNLLELAGLVHLSDLTHTGIVEFLDDLCPCGQRHQVDATRKLRKRIMAQQT